MFLLMHSPQILSDGSAVLDMNHPLAGKEREVHGGLMGNDMSVHVHTVHICTSKREIHRL